MTTGVELNIKELDLKHTFQCLPYTFFAAYEIKPGNLIRIHCLHRMEEDRVYEDTARHRVLYPMLEWVETPDITSGTSGGQPGRFSSFDVPYDPETKRLLTNLDYMSRSMRFATLDPLRDAAATDHLDGLEQVVQLVRKL